MSLIKNIFLLTLILIFQYSSLFAENIPIYLQFAKIENSCKLTNITCPENLEISIKDLINIYSFEFHDVDSQNLSIYLLKSIGWSQDPGMANIKSTINLNETPLVFSRFLEFRGNLEVKFIINDTEVLKTFYFEKGFSSLNTSFLNNISTFKIEIVFPNNLAREFILREIILQNLKKDIPTD